MIGSLGLEPPLVQQCLPLLSCDPKKNQSSWLASHSKHFACFYSLLILGNTRTFKSLRTQFRLRVNYSIEYVHILLRWKAKFFLMWGVIVRKYKSSSCAPSRWSDTSFVSSFFVVHSGFCCLSQQWEVSSWQVTSMVTRLTSCLQINVHTLLGTSQDMKTFYNSMTRYHTHTYTRAWW